MNRSSILAVIAALSFAGAASAADDASCDKFVAAFKKAAQAAGKPLTPDTADFFKKQCAKKPAAEVERDTKCLDGVKSGSDLGKCMK